MDNAKRLLTYLIIATIALFACGPTVDVDTDGTSSGTSSSATGCEARLTDDPQNCGSCGHACPDDPEISCVAGECTGPCGPLAIGAPSICIYNAAVPANMHLGFSGEFSPPNQWHDPIVNANPGAYADKTCTNKIAGATFSSCPFQAGAIKGVFQPGLHNGSGQAYITTIYICDAVTCTVDAIAFDAIGNVIGRYKKGEASASGKLTLTSSEEAIYHKQFTLSP